MSIDAVKTEMNKETVKTDKRTCHICKLCVQRNGFINHFRETHLEREIFKCRTCGYECIFKSRLMEHVTVAHRDKTSCRYCQKNVKNIQMHLEKFHSEKLKMVSCTKCAYAV